MSNKVAGVCQSHGFYLGEQCKKCEERRAYDNTQFMFFTPYTYTDLDVYPIHITSKRQLKEECKKRNLTAVRLL